MRRRNQHLTARRVVLGTICAGIVGVMFFAGALAPASVEEQRKRLPPPAHDCQDPAAGVWMGYQHLSGYQYRFTLHIRRVDPGEPDLEGEIESHFWFGEPNTAAPPPCEENAGEEIIVDMPAKGRFENNQISFIGQSWTLREVVCGRHGGGYFPDGFTGKLIPDGTEFHTENDDGYNPITTVVFRRIRCGDQAAKVPDLPETAAPPSYSSGCCGLF